MCVVKVMENPFSVGTDIRDQIKAIQQRDLHVVGWYGNYDVKLAVPADITLLVHSKMHENR